MRGGVTRKKLLTRRKVADLTREIGLGHGGSLNTRIKEFVRPALIAAVAAAVQRYPTRRRLETGTIRDRAVALQWRVLRDEPRHAALAAAARGAMEHALQSACASGLACIVATG